MKKHLIIFGIIELMFTIAIVIWACFYRDNFKGVLIWGLFSGFTLFGGVTLLINYENNPSYSNDNYDIVDLATDYIFGGWL